MSKKNKLTTREEDYSAWYNEIVEKAGLAEKSDVRGCMVIKPYGFAIRERIKYLLDQMFKNTWHQNAYFPLFIPKSYLSKEADHVEWFAKECAVVTHHRLMSNPDGDGVVVDPTAKLEEELIVRPTSETIIWNTYKNRITSHRDLPLLINQRANVVRREMRTRIFLRTAEFLRQEGHTAHATKEEAEQETRQMLDVYGDVMMNYLAIDGVKWPKCESERFAGAEDTLTIESMMQDGKALQSCTSHFLGQNFAKAFDVTFTNKENEQESVWATSWWMSTRIMGGIIMSHSDDDWLVLPPLVAPLHVAIVPIFKTEEDLEAITNYLFPLFEVLEWSTLDTSSEFLDDSMKITYKIDDDDQKSPGWKFSEYEMKWVPVRVAVGKRDMENGVIEIARRDTGEKVSVKIEDAWTTIISLLESIQENLLNTSRTRREENTFVVDTREEFKEKVQTWFVLAHRDGTIETEEKIKEETKATIRCLPFDESEEDGVCIYTGSPSTQRVLFSRAY